MKDSKAQEDSSQSEGDECHAIVSHEDTPRYLSSVLIKLAGWSHTHLVRLLRT